MDVSTRLGSLFGSEEYVSMRKQLVLMREKLLNHLDHEKQIRHICSGSLGEGVAYPMSDDDVMFYSTKYRVVKTIGQVSKWYDLLMVPSEFSPGYCLLLDVNGSYYDDIQINGFPFLSSSLWKQDFVREGETTHGPCQSGNYGAEEYDHAYCIPCYNWPDVANDWINRNRRNGWPSFEMIESIVQNGCHVVPFGDPGSPYGHHEWRISFSFAERKLMHSFNHTQFLVYNLLRFSLKRIIGELAPDVLCSYFMKTTLFYTAENTQAEFWRVDNLETCFKTCLSVLYDYIDHIYCPNYFIPEYNMIKRKIDHTNRYLMLAIIRVVHKLGIVGVTCISGESYYLDDGLSVQMVEYKLDRDFLSSDHLRKVLASTDTFFDTLHYDDIDNCISPLYNFWCVLRETSTGTRDALHNILLYRGIIYSCRQILHHLCISITRNKRCYSVNKHIRKLIQLGYKGDLTTGKLTMATYMYMIGNEESALSTMEQLLSEYPPYVMDRSIDPMLTVNPLYLMDGSNDELNRTAYIDVMCGRQYSIDYKVKRSYAPLYYLSDRCMNALHSPLRIWTSIMSGRYIDPLTYTFFLQSLCYVQQRKTLSLRTSTRCLVNHINDLKINDDIADARMCVGIVKYLQGENQSACRWLGSVYIMEDMLPKSLNKMFSLSVLTYMSCLLNKRFLSDMVQNLH